MVHSPSVGLFTLTSSRGGNLLMLWAVKIFFVAGALLLVQSAWAFAGWDSLSPVRPEEAKQPAGEAIRHPPPW